VLWSKRPQQVKQSLNAIAAMVGVNAAASRSQTAQRLAASKRFKLRPGKSTTVVFKLNATALRSIKSRRQLAAWVEMN
jgi:hypothetical protein